MRANSARGNERYTVQQPARFLEAAAPFLRSAIFSWRQSCRVSATGGCMQRQRLNQTVAIVSMVLAISACKRQATAPELQTTTGVQPRMEPMVVAGCLRSGLAENTFVLATSGASGADDTAN